MTSSTPNLHDVRVDGVDTAAVSYPSSSSRPSTVSSPRYTRSTVDSSKIQNVQKALQNSISNFNKSCAHISRYESY